MPFRFAHLASRLVLRASGAEAKAFLQGLISNDLEKAQPGAAIYAALLSAQGKILFDFLVIAEREGSYLLDVEAARADELLRKLKLFRLRAKVALEPAELAVAALLTQDERVYARSSPDKSVLIVRDPRHAELGLRLYGKVVALRETIVAMGGAEIDEQAYHGHRLALGVPEGSAELGIEKLFLLEANFEELHGVDFKKGCYVGQELTSRMKHRSELKKRLLPFRVSHMPESGNALTANGREIGSVIGGTSTTAFILVRLDRLAEIGGAQLMIGDQEARPVQPTYLAQAI